VDGSSDDISFWDDWLNLIRPTINTWSWTPFSVVDGWIPKPRWEYLFMQNQISSTWWSVAIRWIEWNWSAWSMLPWQINTASFNPWDTSVFHHNGSYYVSRMTWQINKFDTITWAITNTFWATTKHSWYIPVDATRFATIAWWVPQLVDTTTNTSISSPFTWVSGWQVVNDKLVFHTDTQIIVCNHDFSSPVYDSNPNWGTILMTTT
jgi:hypothetical protein